jgi:uncharacterized membrane protein
MKQAAVIVIVLLALMGSSSAITRAIVVAGMLRGAPADELSLEDRANLELLAALIGVENSSQQYLELEEDTRAGAARYNAVPYATLLHVIPGMAFLLLAPLQLVPRFRRRSAGIHRRMGYLLLGLAVPFAATGFYLSIRDPFFGMVGASASGLAAVWFVCCGLRAYAAIRLRDIDAHRRWMLRALAMAYAIAVIRAISLIVFAFVPLRPRAVGGLVFWVGFLLSGLAAEWWIHRSAPPPARALKWAS